MKKIVILFAALCLSSTLFAEDIKMAPLAYPSTASSGLGGPHIAYTDDVYSLFVNPAALQWANEGLVFDITVGVGDMAKLLKVKDALNTVGGGEIEDALTGLSGVLEGGKLPLGMDLRGPLSFAYTANGLGAGVFMRTSVDARIIGTDIDTRVYSDFMLPFGMAFNVLKLKDHELSAGFVLKPFARAMFDLELSALDLMGDFKLDDIAIPLVAGAGVDLGFMYRFKKDLVVGMTGNYTIGKAVTDLGKAAGFSGSSDVSGNTYYVPFALNTGIAYTFRPTSILSAAVMADWANLQNVFTWNSIGHRNPLLDIGAGVEIGLFSFLKFRVGIHDLLPSVGFGLEPAVFKLNLALYGKELGNEPGVNSTVGFELSISFRPDTKKKNWVWSKPLVK
jgi:hypothetical protein